MIQKFLPVAVATLQIRQLSTLADCLSSTIVMVYHNLSVNGTAAIWHSIYAAGNAGTTIVNRVPITGGICN